MTNLASTEPVATKKDLDDMYCRIEKMVEETVGNTVGSIIGDALQMISKRFDQVDQKFEAVYKRLDRLENKVEEIGAMVEHHTIDIRELQRKTA